MRLYVGITDTDWFQYLKARKVAEMNFWRPRAISQFKALAPNELFLFKSKYPENKIIGGAFFVKHTTLPLELAWKAFGEANGMPSLASFRAKIQKLRRDNEWNPVIGCTILTQPFFLDKNSMIEAPSDWSSNIVTGKSYGLEPGSEGLRLFESAQRSFLLEPAYRDFIDGDHPMGSRFGKEQMIKPRLGQGGAASHGVV